MNIQIVEEEKFEWHSVNKKKPSLGTTVLVYYEHYDRRCKGDDWYSYGLAFRSPKDKQWHFLVNADSNHRFFKVMAWSYLEPPKIKTKGKNGFELR